MASPAWADGTPECNVGTGTESTECGVDSDASQAGGVAVGDGATASGPSGVNPIFASVAVGYNTVAYDNAVAIGNTAIARFSGSVTPLGTGINSAVAVGAGAVAVGSNTIAIGTTAWAGTGFAFNSPGAIVNAGSNITVVGGRAEANQIDATAIGANSNVSGLNGTALGQNTVVTADNAVAIGNGSVADQADTVSVGTVGGERRIVNVAEGVDGTDAVNVSQLTAAVAIASGDDAAAQATANTAVADAAAAQTSANTALAQNVVQDGRLTAVEGVNATQTSQITAIQGVNTAQDTRLTNVEAMNTTQNTRLTSLESLVGGLGTTVELNRREANGGIAAALALGGAVIVPGSNVSMNLNLSTYRGEQGFAFSIAGRVSDKVYLTAGVGGSTVSGSTGGRVGMAIDF